MNIERLKRLIAVLEGARDDQFEMLWAFSKDGSFVPSPRLGAIALQEPGERLAGCGTAACIAGWCGVVAEKTEIQEIQGYDTPIFVWSVAAAAIWLDLSRDSALALFTPVGYSICPERFTRVRALAVLRHMEEYWSQHGQVTVDWSRFTPTGDLRDS